MASQFLGWCSTKWATPAKVAQVFPFDLSMPLWIESSFPEIKGKQSPILASPKSKQRNSITSWLPLELQCQSFQAIPKQASHHSPLFMNSQGLNASFLLSSQASAWRKAGHWVVYSLKTTQVPYLPSDAAEQITLAGELRLHWNVDNKGHSNHLLGLSLPPNALSIWVLHLCLGRSYIRM